MKGMELVRTRAREFGIAGQQEEESDGAFQARVANTLRRQGHIIEAHEVHSGRLYDDPEGDAMTGIAGAIAKAMQGKDYPDDEVGTDIAAGAVITEPEDNTRNALIIMLAMALGGEK